MIPWILIPFALLMIAGVPIAFCLLFATFIFLHAWGQIAPTIIPKNMFSGLDSFHLLAVPFFVLAGQVMNRSGITNRLIHFSNIMVGKIPGGLAQVNVFVSIIFAGLTGSGVADTSAIGSILIPAMEKVGFSRQYSAAVTASSSVIGPIIPPSILMVIYANVMGISVGNLFSGGFVPGIMIGIGLMILCFYYAEKYHHPRRTETVSWREILVATKDAILALIMPIIIIGGILGGIFTPTEAAAVAVGYALFIGFFVFCSLKLRDLPDCFLESAKVSGIILLIISCATAFGWALTIVRMPETLAQYIISISVNPYIVMLLINLFLLFMGMIMEVGANVIILAPILAPLAIKLGVDPLHFAIIMIVNLNIGLATPPLGVCLFVAAPLAKISLEDISRAIFPFLLVEIAVLFLLTYLPSLTLLLPRLLMGYGQ
ncbi:TRAP dicarboxylate transporter, DctM subunit [Candidatus Vecturithrix granuli]|uniref:TRAP dicarboxylate transporter, DctM subunit n=1 Tax=Vecturithrix granuli TaxID=1499967 RepID=A0A081C8D9_VECG1|nr:TRAP dicarboxylate transporter, DctM subunit [Candidatus Vecturithrix granuli]